MQIQSTIKTQMNLVQFCFLADLAVRAVKFGYSEKATKFEKNFHLKFDPTQQCQILSGRFFQILWPSQNIRTLKF